MTLIEVKNLTRTFGKTPVLKDTSMCVESGSVYGLVGLNGAGKTTLIRILLGLLRASGGSARVLGRDPWLRERGFYRSLGVTLDSDGFFGNLTVRENLRIFAEAKGLSFDTAQNYFDEYWGGTDIHASAKKVKYLSRGQRVQCGLCRAFLGWPEAYFFDEPVVSLDFLAYEHFKGLVRTAKEKGAAVLISSHQLEVIDDLCDKVGLLRDGRITDISKDEGGSFSEAIKIAYKGGGRAEALHVL